MEEVSIYPSLFLTLIFCQSISLPWVIISPPLAAKQEKCEMCFLFQQVKRDIQDERNSSEETNVYCIFFWKKSQRQELSFSSPFLCCSSPPPCCTDVNFHWAVPSLPIKQLRQMKGKNNTLLELFVTTYVQRKYQDATTQPECVKRLLSRERKFKVFINS